jgi:hypothetical protein
VGTLRRSTQECASRERHPLPFCEFCSFRHRNRRKLRSSLPAVVSFLTFLQHTHTHTQSQMRARTNTPNPSSVQTIFMVRLWQCCDIGRHGPTTALIQLVLLVPFPIGASHVAVKVPTLLGQGLPPLSNNLGQSTGRPNHQQNCTTTKCTVRHKSCESTNRPIQRDRPYVRAIW